MLLIFCYLYSSCRFVSPCHFDWSKKPRGELVYDPIRHEQQNKGFLRNGEVWGRRQQVTELMLTVVSQMPPFRSVHGYYTNDGLQDESK